jgi:tRNA-splicing ligase RtcB
MEVNYQYFKEPESLVPIKAWTNGVQFEDEAYKQTVQLSTMPFIHSHLAIMPDVHAGKGCTVGSVIATAGAIIPATVGVDIGCVDKNTEFLTPNGWKKISEYTSADDVLVYDNKLELAHFESVNYVKLPCNEFYHIKTKYGVNQKLSAEHTIPYFKYDRKSTFLNKSTITAENLFKKHQSLKHGFRGRFLTSFKMKNSTAINMTDSQIRLMVMICADGCFSNRDENSNRCVLRFKKERKIIRAKDIISENNIEFKENIDKLGITTLTIVSPFRFKCLSHFWKSSPEQLKIICEEVLNWDGNLKDKVYFTRNKDSADFMSYAFSACGKRSVLREDINSTDGKIDYRVFAHNNIKIGINGSPKTDIEIVKSEDGFKYCFTTSTGYWIMRRMGVVAITGNCGMIAVRLNLTASDLPDNLFQIRTAIESAVPHGRTDDGGVNDRGAWGVGTSVLEKIKSIPLSGDIALFNRQLKIFAGENPAIEKAANRAMNHLGTLGSGNHFIELCLDENQDVWIMLHSGSRGIGNRIGSHFIELAKKDMEKWFIHLPDKDLSYIPEGSENFKDYMLGLKLAQEYAMLNRRTMMHFVLNVLRDFFPDLQATKEAINCHHNYVNWERHFGKNVMVTRKGAVSAKEGELGIIPGSMGAKSFIVEGKGNRESFHTCSHGAGRTMSRTQARETFTIEDHIKSTAGVECRKDKEVLDETPNAYKDIDAVMNAQNDLVTIVHTLKQVICVKG